VKHTLSPVVEYALVALVAAYGLFGIYLSSLRPFVELTPVAATSLFEPVPLAPEAWTRHDDAAYGYAFAAPNGWLVDDRDPAAVRVGRSAAEVARAGDQGEGILLETFRRVEDVDIAEIAAADFAGRRPALYDVSVDGRASLFAVDFDQGRVVRQVVYVPIEDAVLIVRTGRLEPAVFSSFVSDIRFYPSEH